MELKLFTYENCPSDLINVRLCLDTAPLPYDPSCELVAIDARSLNVYVSPDCMFPIMRASLAQKQPNEAHRALALLQKKLREIPGTELTLVTQNIDDLHERAGSDGVCHMHGELLSMLCQNCGKRFKFAGRSHPDDICPHCKKRGGVRPDIVFFGEMPYHMEFIEEKLAACDLFLAVGTSGVVYPAAGFCRFAKSRGALCVEFNLEKSAVATDFDYGLYGKASITLKAFTEELMKSGTALSQLPR